LLALARVTDVAPNDTAKKRRDVLELLSKQATTVCDKPFNADTWKSDERSYESSALGLSNTDWT